jgi:hypothetical protein
MQLTWPDVTHTGLGAMPTGPGSVGLGEVTNSLAPVDNELMEWADAAFRGIDQTPARHHRLLMDELEALSRGETDRLMVQMPPGSAKSTYAYVNTDLWGAYVNTPSSPGVWYAWAEGTDGSAATAYPAGFSVT